MLISYKTIGRNIRAARKALALTQEQAASLLDISLLHYGRLERGERPASLEQLALISIALKTTLPALLSGCIEGENFGAQVGQEALSLGETIAAIADGCSRESQELMVELCRTVSVQDKKTRIIR
ncbi:MAG: helix-turn-helix transcriptional regulator [Clostridia bacterium]|nr:helix-turn-helix transcriptional regulator [Clostridia bacterium]